MLCRATLRVALGRRANQQGLWEAGFVVTRGLGDLCVTWKEMIGQFDNFMSW